MSITELQSEVDRLSSEERRQLTAYLIMKDRLADPAFQQNVRRKMDDKDPARWISLDELERREQV